MHEFRTYALRKLNEAHTSFINTEGSPADWHRVMIAMMRYQQLCHLMARFDDAMEEAFDNALAALVESDPQATLESLVREYVNGAPDC